MMYRRIIPSVVFFCSLAISARATVVPIFVVAGQSNATGYRSNSGTLFSQYPQWLGQQANVIYPLEQDYPISWIPVASPTEPSGTGRVFAGVSGFGPELALGKTISDALPGNPLVGVVKYSINATNLSTDWRPDNLDPYSMSDLYTRMRSRVRDSITALPFQKPGLTGKVAGFFWMQGEADAAQGRTTAQYQQDLTNFIATVRTDFNDPNLPFIYGLINNSDMFQGPLGPVEYAGPGTAAVRQAQINVAATVPNTYLVNTDSFSREPTDIIHFDTQGLLQLGTAFGNAYITFTPEPATLVFLPLATLILMRKRNPKLASSAILP